jgi:RimJ/RimL family protein N-acetyltransferase
MTLLSGSDQERGAMIKGDKIYLTELDRSNAETIRNWLNDPEVHRFLLVGHIPLTREEEERYYDSQAAASGAYNFEIHVASDGRFIGHVGLKDVSLIHRCGEIGVVIGSKEDWGKGYGADAIVTCLRFAFLTLGLHSVSIRTEERHERARELYARIGFVETGREREVIYRDGRFHDHIVFDMLDSEFRDRYAAS